MADPLPATPPPSPSLAHPALSGLVLAGGRSRRMGQDKALIEVGGERLVARVARCLAEICAEVVIASGDGRRLADVGWPQIADAMPGVGPLGGILAGLERAGTPLVAVAAVDLPFVSAPVLVRLSSRWHGEAAVVPLVRDRLQPLHAVYDRAAAPALRRLLEAGERSVVATLSQLGARVVGEDVWGDLDPEGRFAVNVNRPADLRTIPR